ncbi:MAG: DUF4295 domain-containing protein [Bacteroidales bacterium]|jgi:hypothetical protein|nr:DUF4295 domain-containing protein [Bacteroidales bacterium]
MAKKVVATLQTKSKDWTKVIRMERSPKTGAYTFKESVVTLEEAKTLLK